MQKTKLMSIGQASRYLGVSRDTLRRWEKGGKIKPVRSPTNRRYYTQEMIDELIGRPRQKEAPEKKKSRESKVSKLIIFGAIGFLAALIIFFLLQALIF